MKKTLLLGSFAVLGLMANAQTVLTCEPTSASMEEAGFVSGEKVTIDGGVVFGSGDAGTIATAYSDSWGMSAPCGDYKNVSVNGYEVTLSNGAVGNANPTFVNYASGVMSAGAVFEIVPTEDGWLTVFTKMSANKQYVVFEGDMVGLAYHLGYANASTRFEYTLPFDDLYGIDFYADDAANYFVAAGGEGPEDVKPQMPYITAGLDSDPGNGTGFLTFNVVAGNKYYFSALGSKAPCGAFVLVTGEEPPTVKFLATDSLPEVAFGPGFSNDGETGAVEALEVSKVDENAPVYNVMGQKVNDDYKGIVIKNGKKFIRK